MAMIVGDTRPRKRASSQSYAGTVDGLPCYFVVYPPFTRIV